MLFRVPAGACGAYTWSCKQSCKRSSELMVTCRECFHDRPLGHHLTFPAGVSSDKAPAASDKSTMLYFTPEATLQPTRMTPGDST